MPERWKQVADFIVYLVSRIMQERIAAQPEVLPEYEVVDNSFAESVFLVEIAERANDRVLADIRTFNAAAVVLLGPILVVVTFVDYGDVRNYLAAAAGFLAAALAVTTIVSGDGKPSPLLSQDFVNDFVADAENARQNIIADLAIAAPENRRQSRSKRRTLGFAVFFTCVSIVGALTQKVVESMVRGH